MKDSTREWLNIGFWLLAIPTILGVSFMLFIILLYLIMYLGAYIGHSTGETMTRNGIYIHHKIAEFAIKDPYTTFSMVIIVGFVGIVVIGIVEGRKDEIQRNE